MTAVKLLRGGLGKTTKIGGMEAGGMIQLGSRTLPSTALLGRLKRSPLPRELLT